MMTTRVFGAALAVCLCLGIAACDDDNPTNASETLTFVAQLSPSNTVPPIANAESTGAGSATITMTVNRDGSNAVTSATANFTVNFTGFPAGTSIATAHIHRGTVGLIGDTVVDTGLTSGQVLLSTGGGSFSRTGVIVSPALAQEIIATPSAFYFDAHSTLNPNGVARGQLVRQ